MIGRRRPVIPYSAADNLAENCEGGSCRGRKFIHRLHQQFSAKNCRPRHSSPGDLLEIERSP
jgi:hypothetical protein